MAYKCYILKNHIYRSQKSSACCFLWQCCIISFSFGWLRRDFLLICGIFCIVKLNLKNHSVQYLSHCLIPILIHVAPHYKTLGFQSPFYEVYVCNINCYDPIQKLYYSAGYASICIYCAEEVADANSEFYCQCEYCQEPKRKRQIITAFVQV